MRPLDFIEFSTLVYEDHAGERATQREGQHAFNCLFMNRPDLSEQIRGRDARDFLAQYGVEWAPKWLLVPSYG